MRDPYLYDDANVLKNFANIKSAERLRKAEADITGISMAAVYNLKYDKFNTETLCDIHKNIFGQIYDWAGKFRTIQMVKYEYVLGGDTVRYAYPKEIKKQLNETMKEIAKLKRTGDNDKEIVFKVVSIIASIWQTHPFREGNTRTVIVFAVLFVKSLGFEVNHELFKTNSAYVRNALVWAQQGIYSKYEYSERIFFDAILGKDTQTNNNTETKSGKYDAIGEYKVNTIKKDRINIWKIDYIIAALKRKDRSKFKEFATNRGAEVLYALHKFAKSYTKAYGQRSYALELDDCYEQHKSFLKFVVEF